MPRDRTRGLPRVVRPEPNRRGTDAFQPLSIIDLFAGPGGWDYAARQLGMDPLGIEWDGAACATREAAGLRTYQADVSKLDPAQFAPCEGLIASPPCQAWSMAGKRQGQLDIANVYGLTDSIATGRPHRTVEWSDERSPLVTEPLRWALTLKPRWIAWEQVPPVIDYWDHVGMILRGEGYKTWTGILSAERYGVPQTRKRAILLASLDFQPLPPEPTHQAYRSNEPAQEEHQLDGTVILPWVSMAEALGWGATEQPIGTVSHDPSGGGSGARNGLKREREREGRLGRATESRGVRG